MPTQTQYQRGTRKERELIAELKKAWPNQTVLRMAGSHGEYDVVAIDHDRRVIEAYQVKYVTKWPSASGLERMLKSRYAQTYYFKPRLRVYLKGNGFKQWPD